jgi:hypothetical protein
MIQFSLESHRSIDFVDYMPDILEDSTIVPDLAVVCSVCKSLIVLRDLKDHRELHQALQIFNLTELPEHSQSLYDRRRILIKSAFVKHMKNQLEMDPRQWEARVTQVNQGFELVKSHLNGTFEQNRQIKYAISKFHVRGESRIVSNESIVAISACSNQNKQYRISMEDTHLILENFGKC